MGGVISASPLHAPHPCPTRTRAFPCPARTRAFAPPPPLPPAGRPLASATVAPGAPRGRARSERRLVRARIPAARPCLTPARTLLAPPPARSHLRVAPRRRLLSRRAHPRERARRSEHRGVRVTVAHAWCMCTHGPILWDHEPCAHLSCAQLVRRAVLCARRVSVDSVNVSLVKTHSAA